MPWIDTIEYDAGLRRAGKIYNIVKISSLTPNLLPRSSSTTKSSQASLNIATVCYDSLVH